MGPAGNGPVPNLVGQWSEARTETRLQGTWVVHQPDRSTTGMWCVDGHRAVFPMQNERPFAVHVADDGAISLQRRAEGYHASLQRFENDDYGGWNGGAYGTRLEGEWTAQLDDGSTAHSVVRGREVRWSDGVRRRFGYEESHWGEDRARADGGARGVERRRREARVEAGARRCVVRRRDAREAPRRRSAPSSEHAARPAPPAATPTLAPPARSCRLAGARAGSSTRCRSRCGGRPAVGWRRWRQVQRCCSAPRAARRHAALLRQYLGSRLTFHLSGGRVHRSAARTTAGAPPRAVLRGTADEIIGLRCRRAPHRRRGAPRRHDEWKEEAEASAAGEEMGSPFMDEDDD